MRIESISLNEVGPFQNQAFNFPQKPAETKGAEIHIFTGPNGSGKSTLLHALANAFLLDNPLSSGNGLDKRFHFNDSSSSVRVVSASYDNAELEYILEGNGTGANVYEEKILSKNYQGRLQIHDYKQLQKPPSQKQIGKVQFDFACFAYSGYRDFSYREIETIKEISQNPLYESLIFTKKTPNQVNQWLANMIAKEAIESKRNDQESAQAYRMNIERMEQVIQRLMNEEVKIELQTQPLNVVLNKNGTFLDFDVIPDGLKSIISWLGDLLMRLDRMEWKDNTPIFDRNIILFLDEIEVHLHPRWQMQVLPIVQELFPNAQVFISTHSPFVVNSVDGAWIYMLKYENGISTSGSPEISETGKSYQLVLDEIFGIEESFGLETEEMLDEFYEYRKKIVSGESFDEAKFKLLIEKLWREGIEVQQIIGMELRQIKRLTQKDFAYDEV
jgi:predicted ATP-binding protein involved in virulence